MSGSNVKTLSANRQLKIDVELSWVESAIFRRGIPMAVRGNGREADAKRNIGPMITLKK